MFHPVQVGKRFRYSYAKISEVMQMPHLLDIQRHSYDWFLKEGLQELFKDISPIEDFGQNLVLTLESFTLGQPKYSYEVCKIKDTTYSAPLRVTVRLINRITGEVKEQPVFMGEFPLMTPTGTFIINGAERAVVSQLVRSPGAYFSLEDEPNAKRLYHSTLIPNRGAWIELEQDIGGTVSIRLDRTRKMPVTIFIRCLGYETNEEILDLFDHHPLIEATLNAEKIELHSKNDALLEIYRRLRPGDPATPENAEQLLHSLFFDPKRYDLASVGRYKFTKKLGWRSRVLNKKLAYPLIDKQTGEILLPKDTVITKQMLDDISTETEMSAFPLDELIEIWVYRSEDTTEVEKLLCIPTMDNKIHRTITKNDMLAQINYFLNVMDGVGQLDDIDHLGNRRIRCVGELLQNQFRIGLTRMERVVKERMSIQDIDTMDPQHLINIRPVTAAMREFFGSSQLSQFMDQHNPLAELTHKRRLSALGPGGLSRERAGFEVRDVHNSHYGRMCPIETPEGANIGLIGSLSNYARINQYGFIETPYRKVDKVNHQVTNEVMYLSADEENGITIAQANEPLDENSWFVNEKVTARRNEETGLYRRENVDFMDVSPRQVVSIATALIPFLENDDANRALMGANMQRQAVPLMKTQAPFVGTGMEYKAAVDSGVMVCAKEAGKVVKVSNTEIVIENDAKEGQPAEKETYTLTKFMRSNVGTCINQTPIVKVNEHVEEGQPIADGPSTELGELALGQNVLVAYMPWEGYNYEDAVLLNENLVKRDFFTSIHIESYECEARDTKLGPEEITRDIPNTSEETLSNLDEEGIICVGAEVRSGDILVGKVTPKGETELTSEERLLRAIFGEKAREVRDTSLRVPHGEGGKVVDVKFFSRENHDELSPGVRRMIRVSIAQKRKISIGDKMSGRHGNKGVVSRIMKQEDMPYLLDGTPVDIVLNPLGVPSRMNIGQILETHLGMAAFQMNQILKSNDSEAIETLKGRLKDSGYDLEKYGLPKVDEAGLHVAVPVFDGAKEQEVFETMRIACKPITKDGVPLIGEDGKAILIDGRTGQPFDNRVTVGCVYMLKLNHLVDDKIHARSTGPYSLVTQQPLGGKAQFGGQRFGEMEVWALEAYGAAYTLQEILTVKSDDVVGRVKTYEAIIKGENIPEPGIPESFKVLMKELQSIGLDVQILSQNGNPVDIDEQDDNEPINRNREPMFRQEMEKTEPPDDFDDGKHQNESDLEDDGFDFDKQWSTNASPNFEDMKDDWDLDELNDLDGVGEFDPDDDFSFAMDSKSVQNLSVDDDEFDENEN